MPSPSDTSRILADLGRAEAAELQRLAFLAAADILVDAPDKKLPLIEELTRRVVARQGSAVRDDLALRYIIAQTLSFLVSCGRPPPIVQHPLHDDEWLAAAFGAYRYSDAELAMALGWCAPFVLEPIAAARERLGISARADPDWDDTIARVMATPGPARTPALLLGDAGWLSRRVTDLALSDGGIAAELARAGIPCDRSTVRAYRQRLSVTPPP